MLLKTSSAIAPAFAYDFNSFDVIVAVIYSKNEVSNKTNSRFFSSLDTIVKTTALAKRTGLTERITNVNFHPLTNLNQEDNI